MLTPKFSNPSMSAVVLSCHACNLLVSGLCGLSERQAVSFVVHVSEEEPQQESDGVLLFLQLSQVPQRIVELH